MAPAPKTAFLYARAVRGTSASGIPAFHGIYRYFISPFSGGVGLSSTVTGTLFTTPAFSEGY